MKCPKCGGDNPDGSKECTHCGLIFAKYKEASQKKETLSSETKACPYCGETILSVAKKCKHCQTMLDGSNPHSVKIEQQDPFAAYHTDIKGKKKGSLSIIGLLGIILGALFIVFGFIMIPDASAPGEGMTITWIMLIGAFFCIGSYCWARR